MEHQVTLPEMLNARERRAFRQQKLLACYRSTMICFTMNIAGPVKNNALILRGYELGKRLLEEQLSASGIQPVHFEETNEITGNEAFYVLSQEPLAVKKITSAVEDGSEVGRLFDMDVLRPDGQKVDRTELGLSSRRCLICGGPAKECARSRAHTVPELQERTWKILKKAAGASDAGETASAMGTADAGEVADTKGTADARETADTNGTADARKVTDAKKAAELAVRALLYEVCTTPKPGLVDRSNNGSHKDMDIFTFIDSACALYPYFEECTAIGRQTAGLPAPDTFLRLRPAGKRAEAAMFSATGGVNTHKGAIFSVGILCAALGRLPRDQWSMPETVLDECAAITRGLTASDFAGLTEETAVTTGQKLYLHHQITGIRGQLEAGLPAVRHAGLPVLAKGVAQGLSVNDAGCAALLALMADATDTNLIARSDIVTQQQTSAKMKALLDETPYPDKETLRQLDREFIEKNLSPGGSADLLAICYLLYFLKSEE